ncbi:MAG TPA: ATP-binding cassette domain-containing protein [Solirubrobacteraceae bacterium]|nr:ATP-binding cassette domain-containing protein [Solirubrobacteraceae bacterium]
MAVMIASDLHKDMAGRPLLRGVSFKLERRERMTVAGRNGAGKTTLLRMLAGEESIDRGTVSLAKGTRVALHDQRPPRDRDRVLRDYVLSGCTDELEIEAELAELERAMSAGTSDDQTLERYARAQARLEARGGYLWRERANAMARGLGFADRDLDRTLDTFSGGQLTRASLARALATGADLLLLDEPTNHLDIESLEWLEQTLVKLDSAIALVAHDRWFLEAVGTSVLELEAGRSRFFAGTWAAWRREQAAREIALGKAIDRQQAEIARMERFVERFRYKATKARQAQSRVKKLAKMQTIERDPRDQRNLEFAFKPAERSGRVVFELVDGCVRIGGGDVAGDDHVAPGQTMRARSRVRAGARAHGGEDGDGEDGSAGQDIAAAADEYESATGGVTLLEHAELWLERGEHVTLVGPNGSGKTTLIEMLAGRRPLTGGRLSTGHNVKLGYLSQHADELDMRARAGGNPDPSVLEATQRATGLTPNKARALLGRFLFSGEQAEKPLAGLSGGERRRLSLAILVGAAQPPNVLILDEPTNHLDIESREALEDALHAFTGAIVLVSHDRALLDAVGTRTVAIEQGTLHSYLGGWPEYVRVREERATDTDGNGAVAASTAPAAADAGSDGGPEGVRAEGVRPEGVRAEGVRRQGRSGAAAKRKAKGPSKNRLSAQAEAEQAVEDAEDALRTLEDELAQPEAWATRYESAKSEARHTAARRAVDEAYARLEALID